MKKKVLFVNPFLFTIEGDYNTRESIEDTIIITMCRGFINLGWEATVIADCRYKPTSFSNNSIEVIYLDSYLKKVFKPTKFPIPKGLVSYLKKNKDSFDLIITSEVFSMYSLLTALVCKQRTIVWHELAMHNRMWKGKASRIWYNLFGRTIFKNIPIAPRSPKARDFIRKYCLNVEENIFDHGVDFEKFPITDNNKDSYFISVSQLVTRKRVDKIIETFADFAKDNKEYSLFICGDGIEKENLVKLVKELGLEERVLFKGKLSHKQLLDIWPQAEALLIYTERDNSMLTISESIVCGTPVISTSIPDSSYLISENNVGIVKDNWGVEELEKIVKNNDYYCQNCNQTRQKLSNTAIAKRFIECFFKEDGKI